MSIESEARSRADFEAGLAALAELLGERFTRNAAIREQHGKAETYHAARTPDAVIFPRSTEEVAAAVAICARHAIPIIAYGAGTSLEGNITAIHGGVCFDMTGMNRIVTVNEADLDCTVEAGVTREELNLHLRDKGLFFPIDPGANATLGGMASTRASGTNAVRYGTMRENVLALKVVTPEGRIITTARRARKSAAGYDLTRLFVGSEGTLGIATEVTLRLYGIPETISAAVCPFESLQGAVDTVVQAIQLGVPMARIELLDDVQIDAVNRWAGTELAVRNTLFFEFHGSEAHVREQVETVRAISADNGGGDFSWASTTEERNRLWKARHQAYYAALNLRPGSTGWSTDVCVPISRLAECIVATKADLAGIAMPAPIVGHVGDGNFHVTFVLDPERPEEFAEARRINARLVERALAMGGTCTGEHGVGLGKIDWLEAEHGEAVELMRRIKRAIDPANIMNPGKILRLPPDPA
ncbi:FAD-binding oxidoreductase [Edaphosphingomonas haloaromaticamans]|uniref:D-lactate dehydrogenase (cytochrome) n=1 Tax=Edaphosphingomonas haloaromaticamans TaxID=653954 RepID=A0A1S1H955_9SPHN|nr:FAD-linked oxidase C-terminal domain-containing protein [Sphingomonas haloaromaticamans]OHT18637.1 putative FAD-linked oxidoreductase [Sphingomonas haloaromaticamans]